MYTYIGLSLTVIHLLGNLLLVVMEIRIAEKTVVPGSNFDGDHVGLKGLIT